MYFKNGNFMYFTPPNTIDANRTIKLPDASGTVALEDKTENWVYPGTTSSYSQLSSDVNIASGGNVSPNNVSYLPADPYTGQEVYVKSYGTTASIYPDPSTNFQIEVPIFYNGVVAGIYGQTSITIKAWEEGKFVFRSLPSPSWDYQPQPKLSLSDVVNLIPSIKTTKVSISQSQILNDEYILLIDGSTVGADNGDFIEIISLTSYYVSNVPISMTSSIAAEIGYAANSSGGSWASVTGQSTIVSNGTTSYGYIHKFVFNEIQGASDGFNPNVYLKRNGAYNIGISNAINVTITYQVIKR
jgi:hypothetical protein